MNSTLHGDLLSTRYYSSIILLRKLYGTCTYHLLFVMALPLYTHNTQSHLLINSDTLLSSGQEYNHISPLAPLHK